MKALMTSKFHTMISIQARLVTRLGTRATDVNQVTTCLTGIKTLTIPEYLSTTKFLLGLEPRQTTLDNATLTANLTSMLFGVLEPPNKHPN